MEASRQQLEALRVNQGTRPVLEEFIPIKNLTTESSEKPTNISDKANWMTSAQLWSQTTEGTKQQPTITSPKETDNIGFNISPKPVIENKHRNGGGAFLPFSKERQAPSTLRPLPELALASSEKQSMEDKKHGEAEKGKRENNSSNDGGEGSPVTAQTTTSTNTNNSNQTHRKARRCWSPDLHRRFVNALQMLGGSQGTHTITI